MRTLWYLLALALVPLWLGACTPIVKLVHPNQPPSVRFTLAPVAADRSNPVFYAYRVFWAGDDPDGRVDHFEYAIDPGPRDTVWVSTPRSEEVLFFGSTTPDPHPGPIPTASDFHVLVLRAVDDKGAYSPRPMRAFYSYTVAPTVTITAPHPNRYIAVQVPPSLFVTWTGTDPDGQHTTRPVKYRFRLLPFDATNDGWMLGRLDSLYARERAAGFAQWDSTGPDTTFARFTNLTVGSHYLFLVIAYDEAGARSPVLSLDDNALLIEVSQAATLGPRIHVFNEFLDFTYDSGGYTTDPLRWIRLDAPAGRDIVFNWDAVPAAGSAIESYRWGVDLASVQDETPRSDEDADITHWSRRSPLTQSCTLRGLPPGVHFLYIEARDNNGYASLGIVALTLVVPTFDRDLLIVDDTRLEPDKPDGQGCQLPYTKEWPSAAELDTFLYARGGFPWRCTGQAGATSVPGVFAGYDFDTLGTRLGLEVPSFGVRLGKLGQYRQVVWLVDGLAAGNVEDGGQFPITVLRYSSSPGRASVLAAYVQAGGRVWLAGGGAGTASIVEFNATRNDAPGRFIYSNSGGDLVPGRLMVDGAHWQSAFTADSRLLTFRRSPSAERIAAAPWSHADRWTGTLLSAPNYLRLPEELAPRDPATDPLPASRVGNLRPQYYRTRYTCEYLIEPNFITEDVDTTEDGVRIASTLDTLIEASSLVLLRSPAPTMTWYHGREANRFVFTGFAPWDFRRQDCIALTDFVLQDIWGLPRRNVDRGFVPERPATVRQAPPRPAIPPGTRRAARGYQ